MNTGTLIEFQGHYMSGLATLVIQDDETGIEYVHCVVAFGDLGYLPLECLEFVDWLTPT